MKTYNVISSPTTPKNVLLRAFLGFRRNGIKCSYVEYEKLSILTYQSKKRLIPA